jgi:hypothetical protein
MRKFFAIILEVDAKASIRTNTGKIIKRLDDFPAGQKFSDAFKPEESDDTKFVKMTFCMTSTPSPSHIKTRHQKLVEHLQLHQMYMDESQPDEEELIGYFMGFQAEKTYLVGFSDDLREILTRMILQPGERKVLDEAKKALTWPSDGCPPFYARARNITRVQNGSQYTSKAVGITTAKEHSSFFKSLLIRSQEKHKLNGLGRHINTPTDRRFFKAIKWHNDQIEPTSTLPVIGISCFAMLHPLKAHRADGSGHAITNPRDELIKSGNFSTIHSTKQTFDEGRWILIVANKAKIDEASAFFFKLVKLICGGKNGQIPPEARSATHPIPIIEEKSQTEHNTSSNLPSAWGSTFSSDNKTEGGSRLRNMPKAAKRQQRKVVELSFDPESIEEFPHIDKDTKHNSSRSVNSTKSNKSSKSQKSSKSHKSNASSDSGSVVSAVTRANFTNLAEGLSKDISKLIRNECSVMTSSTDASALEYLKEELLAGRKQQEITNNTMKESLQLMSTMLAQFMNTQVQRTQPPPVSQSAHSAPFSASSVSDTNASQDPRAPHSPIIDNTQVQQYDVPPFSSRLIKSQRRVTIKNVPVGDDPEHPTPTST